MTIPTSPSNRQYFLVDNDLTIGQLSKTNMKACNNCGSGEMVRRTTEVSRRVEGHQFIVSVPASCCKQCGEAYIDGPLLERVELQIALGLLESAPLSGGAFRFIRKALGLSAVTIAELLDVAPETVSRWENGKRAIDRVEFAILGALLKDALADRTDTLDLLRRMRDAKQHDEPIRLDLSGPIALSS